MAYPPDPWPKLKDVYVKGIMVVGKRLTNFGPVYVLEDGSTLTEKEFYDLMERSDPYYLSSKSETKMFEAPKKTRETLAELRKVFNVKNDKPGLLEADKAADKALEAFKEAFSPADARDIDRIIDQDEKLLTRLDKKRERELERTVESYSAKNKIISDQVKILRGSEEDVSIFGTRLYVGDADVEILKGFQGDSIHLTTFLPDKNFSHRKIINRSAAKIKIRSQEFIDAKKHLRFIEIESYDGSIDIVDYSDVNVWAFDKTKEIKVSDSKNVTIKVYGTKAHLNIDNNNKDCSIWTYNDFGGTITYQEKPKAKKLSLFQKFELWRIKMLQKY